MNSDKFCFSKKSFFLSFFVFLFLSIIFLVNYITIQKTIKNSRASTLPSVTPTVYKSSRVLNSGLKRNPQVPCYDDSEFVRHVNVAENSWFNPGDPFQKSWLIKNTGTCIMKTSYLLIFNDGNQFGAPTTAVFPTSFYPNENFTLTLNMVAPTNVAKYYGYWKLKNDENKIFGKSIPVTINVGNFSNLPIKQVDGCTYNGRSVYFVYYFSNGKNYYLYRQLKKGDYFINLAGDNVVDPLDRFYILEKDTNANYIQHRDALCKLSTKITPSFNVVKASSAVWEISFVL